MCLSLKKKKNLKKAKKATIWNLEPIPLGASDFIRANQNSGATVLADAMGHVPGSTKIFHSSCSKHRKARFPS